MKNRWIMGTMGVVTLALFAHADAQGGHAVRELVDPSTGLHWMVVPDASHPGGPGKLVPGWGEQEGRPSAFPLSRPVIRAGESVQVEEHSARVDMRMEAVALASARKGDRFRVRLRIGGKVLTVNAVCPGRAVLEDEGSTR